MIETKRCPYCGEEIMVDAKKCKHCGEWLERDNTTHNNVVSQDNLKKSRKNYNGLIVFLIIVAVIISGFCLYSKNKEEEKSTEVVKEGPIIHFDDNLSDDSEQNETNDENQQKNKFISDLLNENNDKDDEIENYDVETLIRIGECYEKGIEVEENLFTAFRYYEKAAKTGDATALNKLGNMYAQGRGCMKDSYKAAQCYKAAAEKGNKYAQHNIAFCYWDGMGVEKNHDLAIMWMRRSAEQGYEKAYKALEMMEGK